MAKHLPPCAPYCGRARRAESWSIRRLRDTVGADNVVEFSVCAGRPGEAEAPLGWELSREMIERLNGQVSSCLSQPIARLRALLPGDM